MEHGYSLSDIARITGGTLAGDGDMRITTLLIDSRRSVPLEGALFIALHGPHHDGHAHIRELAAKGLQAAMVDRQGAGAATDLSCVVVEGRKNDKLIPRKEAPATA